MRSPSSGSLSACRPIVGEVVGERVAGCEVVAAASLAGVCLVDVRATEQTRCASWALRLRPWKRPVSSATLRRLVAHRHPAGRPAPCHPRSARAARALSGTATPRDETQVYDFVRVNVREQGRHYATLHEQTVRGACAHISRHFKRLDHN